jgi:hypothetical protein
MKVNSTFILLAVAVTLNVLVGSAAQAVTITNPSFETGCLDDWTTSEVKFGADVLGDANCGGSLTLNGFPTDGSKFGRIYSGSNSDFVTGQFGSVGQQVDFTSISAVIFDASLERFASGGEQNSWDSNFQAGFFIDGVAMWTKSTFSGSNYLDQFIDTSSFTGMRTIEFRNTRIGPDGFAEGSNWFLFDNLRTVVIPEPTTFALTAIGLLSLGMIGRRGRRR